MPIDRSDVREVTLQTVHQEPEHVWGSLDDRGAIALQGEMCQRIDRLGIRSQQQRLGIRQVFPDHHLLRFDRAEHPHAFAPSGLAHAHHLCQVHLRRPVERLQVA